MRLRINCFRRKKLTLKVILAILLLNISITLLTLYDQGGSKLILKIYYHNTYSPLLITLNTYRTRYLVNTDGNIDETKLITEEIHHKHAVDIKTFDWLKDDKYSNADPPPTTEQFNDNIFSSKSFLNDILHPHAGDRKSFYEPEVLINNPNACSSRQNKIFIVCMIHSHRNKYTNIFYILHL